MASEAPGWPRRFDFRFFESFFDIKSGFSSFDHAAELAIRNAVLDPLPKALAENPPYIVLIRIVPQN